LDQDQPKLNYCTPAILNFTKVYSGLLNKHAHRHDVSIMYLLYAVCFKEGIIIKVTDSHRTSSRTFIQLWQSCFLCQ